jgi:hypothetical protein
MAEAKQDRQTYTTEYIKGDFDRSVFLDSPYSDNLMTVVLGLGAEYWAMRRRMMVLEKLLADKRVVDEKAIEAYNPSAAEKVVWDAERDDFIERIYSVLTRPTLGKVGGALPQDRVAPIKP